MIALSILPYFLKFKKIVCDEMRCAKILVVDDGGGRGSGVDGGDQWW